MKKRLFAAFLLAAALVVGPSGNWFSTVATATSNSTLSSEMEEIVKDATVSNASTAVDTLLKSYSSADIERVMVSEEGKSFVDQLSNLEDKYMEAMGSSQGFKPEKKVVVDEAVGIKSEDIRMAGAGLSCNYAYGVTLKVEAAPEQATVPEGYENAVQLEISLEGVYDTLLCPVAITMPVPAGISADNVAVLHYAAGINAEPEVLTTLNNGDGTVSFCVNSFSVFVFAEDTMADTPDDSDDSDDSDDGGSSAGGGESGFADSVEQQIESAQSGATVTITRDQNINALSNGMMKALLERGDVTLVLEYTYEGANYTVTIPAGKAVDNDIPWYGPLYLAAHYGNSAAAAGTAGGADYIVKANDTMSKIARANGMTVAQLAAKNPQIKDVNMIKVGQSIKLK